MKKRFFVLLMSIAMVVTMMPISVLATTDHGEKNEVITPLGNTGLYLVGDREAKESSSWDTHDGDYYIFEKTEPYYVDIDTSGWLLKGTSDHAVYITSVETNQKITLENVNVPYFGTDTANSEITIKEGTEFNVGDIIDVKGDVTFNGTGAINCKGMNFWEGSYLTIDGPTFYSENTDEECQGICADGGIDIKSGKVIAVNTKDTESSFGLFTNGEIKISDEAEVFVNGPVSGMAAAGALTFDKEKCYGNAEVLGYESKDKITSGILDSTIKFDDREFNTLAVKSNNESSVAKTVYHPGTSIHKVQFFNREALYQNEYIKDGECATKPEVDPEYEKGKSEFSGWSYLSDEGKFVEYDFSKPVTCDLDLYATYEIYNYVTFDSQGGSNVETQKVLDNGFAQKPEDPTKEGYTFEGWYLTPNSEGKVFDFEKTPIENDITLYAKWSENAGSNTKANGNNSTGDSTNILLIAGACLAATGLLTVIVLKKKGKNNKRKEFE